MPLGGDVTLTSFCTIVSGSNFLDWPENTKKELIWRI